MQFVCVLIGNWQGYYVPPDFALPVVEVDAVKVQGFQEAYETLKARLLKETLVSVNG